MCIRDRYKSPPVSIDGISFNLTYFPHVFNDEEFIHGLYTIADEDLDIPAAYIQLEKYFNNVYGKGEKYEKPFDWATDYVGKVWTFSIDTGKEYRLSLSYYRSSHDDEENAPYYFEIYVSPNFTE